MQKYKEWILQNVPQDPEKQLAQCVKFVPMMAAVFPELSIKKGVVFSKDNLDNFENNLAEYLHMWLTDANNNIIDPTINQYCLMGKLEYKEFDSEVTTAYKCHNCGKYFTDLEMDFHPACSAICEQEYAEVWKGSGYTL